MFPAVPVMTAVATLHVKTKPRAAPSVLTDTEVRHTGKLTTKRNCFCPALILKQKEGAWHLLPDEKPHMMFSRLLQIGQKFRHVVWLVLKLLNMALWWAALFKKLSGWGYLSANWEAFSFWIEEQSSFSPKSKRRHHYKSPKLSFLQVLPALKWERKEDEVLGPMWAELSFLSCRGGVTLIEKRVLNTKAAPRDEKNGESQAAGRNTSGLG